MDRKWSIQDGYYNVKPAPISERSNRWDSNTPKGPVNTLREEIPSAPPALAAPAALAALAVICPAFITNILSHNDLPERPSSGI